MRKQRISEKLRTFAKDHLSPTEADRRFVSRVYAAVCDVIGVNNALQIGSYPRFTAIRPLHDLDVLYILGDWNPLEHDPSSALRELERRLLDEFENPTSYRAMIELQTHSVTIRFLDGEDEVFAIDVVPAYRHGRNDRGEDMYVVPEIARASRSERRRIRAAVARGEREMAWIRSDPRGYIAVARDMNATNSDFRKAVKIAKGWRAACKRQDASFALKSFHLEQAITRWLTRNPHADIFDMVFAVFCDLPDLIRYPQIPDRADPARKIDDYVRGITEQERRQILEARDGFLIALENLAERDPVIALLQAPRRRRASPNEAYLFDQRIPVFSEHDFSIIATALERQGSFRRFILDMIGRIPVDRAIEFRLGSDAPEADLFKWKVKNDDASAQPRGEITDHRTLQDPEHTKFRGHHHVECFAIRDGVCVGRTRQNVVLDATW
ncbi:nucleotidyltransferase [Aureimonas frigidaquae]|uniref:Adenylyl/Guanylyl and SMODS C-terminal sensor domain-containing protein n=1 Tax=Aureimonas frigidaquae TaxID=424757 RepID=A0A0N7KXN2_9HYPH|nr:nucleotidyltransferase [Aureimonas frigidaquae]BAT27393.1 hypothetical protein [Aureimonas frigidaquae]